MSLSTLLRAIRALLQVEGDVRVDEGRDVAARLPHVPEMGLQQGHVLVGGPLGGQPGGDALHVRPHLDEVLGAALAEHQPPVDRPGQELGGALAHVGAGTGPDLDDAEDVQRGQRAADAGARHTEGLGELAFRGQPGAGPDVSGREVVEEPLGDLADGGLTHHGAQQPRQVGRGVRRLLIGLTGHGHQSTRCARTRTDQPVHRPDG
jgi:hypothetical protein